MLLYTLYSNSVSDVSVLEFDRFSPAGYCVINMGSSRVGTNPKKEAQICPCCGKELESGESLKKDGGSCCGKCREEDSGKERSENCKVC